MADQQPPAGEPAQPQRPAQPQQPQYPQYPPQGYPPPGYPPPGYLMAFPPGPQPLSPSDERMWGMLSYILAIFGGIFAPLIIFLVYKDRSAFVGDVSRESLNLRITEMIVSFGGLFVLMIGGFGVAIFSVAAAGVVFILLIVALVAFSLGILAIDIVAGMKAYHGEYWRIPYILRLIK